MACSSDKQRAAPKVGYRSSEVMAMHFTAPAKRLEIILVLDQDLLLWPNFAPASARLRDVEHT